MIWLTRPKIFISCAVRAGAHSGIPGDGRGADRRVQSTLASYLATVPEGEAKAKGIQLGQEVAAKILAARENDGASAPAPIGRGPSRASISRPQCRLAGKSPG